MKTLKRGAIKILIAAAILCLVFGGVSASMSAQNVHAETVIDTGAGYTVNPDTSWAKKWIVYFGLTANDAPASDTAYKPATKDQIKLIRDGVAHEVGNPDAECLKKNDANQYQVETWYFGDYATLKAGDIVVVEGKFSNASNGYTLNISKTYITLTGDGVTSWTNTVTDKIETVIEAGAGFDAGEGATAQAEFGELKFSMDENAAAVNYRFTPTTEDAVKLVRSGETKNVGHTARETILKVNETIYSFQVWVLADNKPLLTGDVLILEGKFQNAELGVTLDISTTYIKISGETGALTYTVTDTLEDDTEVIAPAGYNDEEKNPGTVANITGLYFRLAENDAPYEDWSIEYDPVTADAFQLIRGDQTYDLGITLGNRGTIVKFSATQYYLKVANGWTVNNYDTVFPKGVLAGDIIKLEGTFRRKGRTEEFSIGKTYFVVGGETGALNYTVSSFNMVEGAEVRVASTGNGIRFVSEIGPLVEENAEYHMLIVPASYVEGMTGDYYAQLSAKYSYLADMKAEPFKYESAESGKNPDVYYVRGSLTDIKYANLNVKFFGIAYKQVGDSRIYASFTEGENVRSIAGVSSSALNASRRSEVHGQGALVEGEIKAALEDYVNKAVNSAAGKAESETASVELKLDRTTLNLIPGESYTLKCENLPDGADIEIYNETDNGNIATISGFVVTAGSVTGTTYVKAYIGGQYNYVEVNVQTTRAKIGVWAGTTIDAENEKYLLDDAALTRLADAGINEILGVWHNPDESLWSYKQFAATLDRAEELGIKIYPKYEGDGSTVPSYYTHNAIGGFIIFDEPGISKFAELKTIKDKVEEKTHKPCIVNLMGGSCSNESLGISDTSATNAYMNDMFENEYVKGFISAYNPSMLSYDCYPITVDYSTGENRSLREFYFRDFDIYSYNAKNNDIPFYYTLQSCGHDTGDQDKNGNITKKYPVPTAEDMRWQISVAMTFGAAGVNHYVYSSHADDYAGKTMFDYSSGKTTQLFEDMKVVNRETALWSGIYAEYEWEGISSVGSNDMFVKPAYRSGLKKIAEQDCLKHKIALEGITASTGSGQSALIGSFKNASGGKAYMITNANDPASGTKAEITLNFTNTCTQVKVITRGITEIKTVTNNKITLTVNPSDGIFVIPV